MDQIRTVIPVQGLAFTSKPQESIRQPHPQNGKRSCNRRGVSQYYLSAEPDCELPVGRGVLRNAAAMDVQHSNHHRVQILPRFQLDSNPSAATDKHTTNVPAVLVLHKEVFYYRLRPIAILVDAKPDQRHVLPVYNTRRHSGEVQNSDDHHPNGDMAGLVCGLPGH